MNSSFVIRLGSGGANKYGVGSKGRFLDLAARAGLPVPRGVLVLDTVVDLAVLHGAAEQDDTRLRVVDAKQLSALLDLPPYDRLVAVRSAFSAEDTEDRALAGSFHTVLRVDPTNADALGRAVEAVWSSGRPPDLSDTAELMIDAPRIRRDILIMEMVEAEISGVAFTEREFEDDLVNHTAGTSERLLSGQIAGETLSLPKLRGWEKMPQPRTLPAWAARLQALLRDVRRWLGARDWDVEWADDGRTCWLIQLRPVTRPVQRDETFTIANHKEILPHLPSPFMTSLVESCAFELYSYYRDFDPSLPKGRPFLEVFHGRPYINLSLMAETMRHWGLPTRLVTENIGGAADQDYGLNLGRVTAKTLRFILLRQALAQILSVRRVNQAIREIGEQTAPDAASLKDWVDVARSMYIMLVQQAFALLAASGPIVSVLARFGVLSALSAHHETISTRKFRAQQQMRAYAAGSAPVREALRAGEVSADEGFMALWEAYLADFGHRGAYESDLARPRDSEAPASLLMSLASPPQDVLPKPKLGVKARLMWPLWWQASRVIRARELWRHEAMRGFAAVRAGLLCAAAPFVQNGALPDADHLWKLRVDEVRDLAEGWRPDEAFWTMRQQEVDALTAIQPPDMLRRFERPSDGDAAQSDVSRLHGIPLTRGKVSGRAWVLHEPAWALPEGFTSDGTILIARSVDVGWVGTFAQVAAVGVETGGHLSHGSIVLREIGLPAVTNAAGAASVISTGDEITLDADRGVILRGADTAERSLDSESSR